MPDEQDKGGDEATTSAAPRYVTQLNSNDVLMGRGAPSIDNEGNIRFRELVQSRKHEYMSTKKRLIKDSIARDIVDTIEDRSGRFLRKIETQDELNSFGLTEGTSAWVAVDEDTALLKVKQALRGKEKEDQSEKKQQKMRATEAQEAPTIMPPAGTAMTTAPVSATQTVSRELGDILRLQQQQLQQQEHIVQQHVQQQQQQHDMIAASQRDSALAQQQRAMLESVLGERFQHGYHQGRPLFGGPVQLTDTLLQNTYRLTESDQQLQAARASMTADFLSRALASSLPSINPQLPINQALSSNLAQHPVFQSAIYEPAQAGIFPAETSVGLPARPLRTQALADTDTSVEESVTWGDQALRLAHERAIAISEHQLDASQCLGLTPLEYCFLKVLCSQGPPVHADPLAGTFSSDQTVRAGSTSVSVRTWSSFADLVRTTMDTSSSGQFASLPSSSVGGPTATAHHDSRLSNDRHLASTVVALLRRIQAFAGDATMISDDPSLLKAWFAAELERWNTTFLDVSHQRHESSTQTSEHIAFLDRPSCRILVLQIASLARLRSLFVERNYFVRDRLVAALGDCMMSETMWAQRPPWWEASAGGRFQHDALLLENLMTAGYQRLSEKAGDFGPEHQKPGNRATSLRQLGLTLAALQERVQQLALFLHQREDQLTDESALTARSRREVRRKRSGDSTSTVSAASENSQTTGTRSIFRHHGEFGVDGPPRKRRREEKARGEQGDDKEDKKPQARRQPSQSSLDDQEGVGDQWHDSHDKKPPAR